MFFKQNYLITPNSNFSSCLFIFKKMIFLSLNCSSQENSKSFPTKRRKFELFFGEAHILCNRWTLKFFMSLSTENRNQPRRKKKDHLRHDIHQSRLSYFQHFHLNKIVSRHKVNGKWRTFLHRLQNKMMKSLAAPASVAKS